MRRLDHQSSWTAVSVAALRHAGTHESEPRVRCADHLARLFIGRRYRLLTSPGLRRITLALNARKSPGMYEWVLGRSHWYDQAFSTALTDGINQIVVLGAGYDSRAIRFGAALARARGLVFEVDHPRTQLRKRHLLGVDPARVRWVPGDLEYVDLGLVLPAAGYDPAQPTLVLGEAVLMYLSEVAIEHIFGWLGRLEPGSRVAFDYNAPNAVASCSQAVADLGEPLRWSLPPNDVETFLRGHNLKLCDHLDAADVHTRHLSPRLALPAEFCHLVLAQPSC